jgi:group I intron endonuclease
MKKEVIIGVYKITSPSGKIYIGESKDIYKRWVYYKALNCQGQVKLYNSFKKHGVKNHIFEIIEECDFDDLLCRERYWQDFYEATGRKGLNCFLTQCGEKKKEFGELEKRNRQLNWHNSKVVVSFETGEEYISLAEACRILNLNYSLENLRVFNQTNSSLFYQKDKPFEKTVEIPQKVIHFETSKKFNSLKEACDELGLNYIKEYNRITKKSCNAIFYYEGDFFERSNIFVCFETGKEYLGLRQACKETGEDYKVQAYSISGKFSTAKFYVKGKKFERLVAKQFKKAICFKTGEVFENISIACKERGLNYDIERALTADKSKRATFYYEGEYFEGKETNLVGVISKLTGIEYRSITKACKEEGLNLKKEWKLLKSKPELSNLEVIENS